MLEFLLYIKVGTSPSCNATTRRGGQPVNAVGKVLASWVGSIQKCLYRLQGTYKVRNEIETKRNETKGNQRKRNETKRDETKSKKRNQTKRNQRNENEIKRNQRKQNEINENKYEENGRKKIKDKTK